jgi:hypothetical protein
MALLLASTLLASTVAPTSTPTTGLEPAPASKATAVAPALRKHQRDMAKSMREDRALAQQAAAIDLGASAPQHDASQALIEATREQAKARSEGAQGAAIDDLAAGVAGGAHAIRGATNPSDPPDRDDD